MTKLNPKTVKVKNKDFSLKKFFKEAFNIEDKTEKIDDDYVIVDFNKIDNNTNNENNLVGGKTTDNAKSILGDNMSSNKYQSDAYKNYIEARKKYPKGSIELKNAELNWCVEKAGYGTRAGVVAAAKYLSENENIPYFWGGKCYEFGINSDWGTDRVVYALEESYAQPNGYSFPYGLDCSGFVTWSIINGGYKCKAQTGEYVSYTEAYAMMAGYENQRTFSIDTFNEKNNGEYVVKEGDLLHRDGHIAIITNINRKYNVITVAEEYDYPDGMKVTSMDINDYVETHIGSFTDVILMEDYYSNSKNIYKK